LEGKVALFDVKQELGIIVSENNIKHKFKLDSWKEKDAPKVGQIVEFTSQNGFAFEIFFKKEVPKELMIKPTISPETCLDEFFYDIEKFISSKKDYLNNKNELNYEKMKRFLYTAYNTLNELETNLNDQTLTEYKMVLTNFTKLKDEYFKRIKYPKIVYEKIFLKKQPEYIKLKEDIDGKIAKIDFLQGAIRSLEPKITQLEEELKNLNPKDEKYIKVEEHLKIYNRYTKI